MHIDERIERHVREAFSNVVGRDRDGLLGTLRPLSPADLQTAVNYAMYACGYVVMDVLEGELSEDGLAELARDTVEGTRDWMDLGDPGAIASFLRAAASGDPAFRSVPEEDVAGHAFVVGGYLLSRYRHEGQRWFEYLDDAWNDAVASDS
jgi:hypothetical protein